MELQQYLVEKLVEKNEQWHAPEIGRYHASRLREIFYGSLNAENFFDPPHFNEVALQTMAIGEAYHDFIQKFFERVEEKHIIPLDTKGDIKIVMKIDAVHKGIPQEFKTCTNIPDTPPIKHKTQLMAAMAALDKPYGHLSYIKKDPKRFITRTYKIEFDQLYWIQVTEKVKELHAELIKQHE